MNALEIADKYLHYPKALMNYLNAKGYTGEFLLNSDQQCARMSANRKRNSLARTMDSNAGPMNTANDKSTVDSLRPQSTGDTNGTRAPVNVAGV